MTLSSVSARAANTACCGDFLCIAQANPHAALFDTDTELSREIEQTIEQADGSAYMAIFTTTSTSGVPPEKYFKDARIEIERCAKSMDELAAMIGLKL